jgi:hypothetical protein
MTRPRLRLLLLILSLATTACAGAVSTATPPIAHPSAPQTGATDDAAALTLQRDWWRAFTVADTAYLQAHTAPAFWMTLSNGRTYDRAGMLAQAATHVNGAGFDVRWADESVRLASPAAVVATGSVTETAAGTSHVYRYLTALERSGTGWRVAAAQSTRELTFTPRVPATVSGPLADYAGGYRTPRGGALQVMVRDSSLALIEPSGAELPMEPIGPALFEFRNLSMSNGIVRFAFARDTSGRVTAMTRLIPGQVSIFPRIP